MILFYYIYNNNGKSNCNTVIVVKRVFSLAKTIVVDVIVIHIPRIPVVFFVMGTFRENAHQCTMNELHCDSGNMLCNVHSFNNILI